MKTWIKIMGGVIIFLPIFFIGLLVVYYMYSDKFAFNWDAYWITIHDLCIALLSWYIARITIGNVKNVFRWIMLPYISFKSLYDVICFTNLTIFTTETWDWFWKILFLVVMTIFTSIILFLKVNGKAKKRWANNINRGITFVFNLLHHVCDTISRYKYKGNR